MSGKIERDFVWLDGKCVPLVKVFLEPCDADDNAAWEERNLLAGRIEQMLSAPVVERQPVAYRCFDGEGNYDYWDDSMDKGGNWNFPTEPLYTSPPAPVAVPVEIHQQLIEMRQQFERANFVALGKLLTACLDKVKELNQ